LGQDEMLKNAASNYERIMARRVKGFLTGILKSLARMVHTDPTINLKLQKRIPNTNISIPFRYKAGKRDGKWLELVFKMSAYGAKELAPSEQYMAIKQLMTDFIIPLAQSGQVTIKGPEIIREAAKCLGYEQIESMVEMPSSPGEMMQGSDSGPKQYEHISRPAQRPQPNWGEPGGTPGGSGQEGQQQQQPLRMPA